MSKRHPTANSQITESGRLKFVILKQREMSAMADQFELVFRQVPDVQQSLVNSRVKHTVQKAAVRVVLVQPHYAA